MILMIQGSKRVSLALVVMSLVVFSAASIVGASESLKIGANLPFSGVEANIGYEYERVIERAVAEINADVQVFYADGAGDLDRAIAGFMSLLEKDIDVIITVQSWVSNVIYPLAQEHGVLHIALGSAVFHRDLDDDLSVRLTLDYKDEAAVLASYVAERFDRVAIIYMDNDYGNGWASELDALFAGELGQTTGTQVVAIEAYDLEDTNFGPIVSKVAANEPDVLVLLSSAETAFLLRAADAVGLSVPLVSTRPIERPEVAAEPLAEGLVFTVPDWDSAGELSQWYRWKYNGDLTVFGAEAYDAVVTLGLAAEQCGTDTACLKAWYVNREYEGVLGSIRFDAVGDAHYAVTFRILQNGQFINL